LLGAVKTPTDPIIASDSITTDRTVKKKRRIKTASEHLNISGFHQESSEFEITLAEGK